MDGLGRINPVVGTAQLSLIHDLRRFPQTRYQGSKLKLLPWIWEHIAPLDFRTCLDAFGGTGCVAYLLKTRKKSVTYNDILRSNWLIGKALIENSKTILDHPDIQFLLCKPPDKTYDDLITRTFGSIYFTTNENRWLDMVCQNIRLLADEYKRALAYFALFQACIVKRPYNLFHRANLYMRRNHVKRSFGNKTTWERPFEDHFRDFAAEGSSAVFDSGVKCTALNADVFDLGGDFDLVYIDTPYMNRDGIGPDYFDFYHFLEGLADYEAWEARIDRSKRHLPLKSPGRSPWLDKAKVLNTFGSLFDKFRKSQLVLSYRTDGIPSPEQLVSVLRRQNRKIMNFSSKGYRYVLSHNSSCREALIVAI
jgi:adenine-specific DNA methylase